MKKKGTHYYDEEHGDWKLNYSSLNEKSKELSIITDKKWSK